MANKYMNFYMNNPTAGGTDGTAVSLDDANNAPLTVRLDPGKSESQIIKCAVRCASGYVTDGDTVISFTGENASKWSIAADDGYADESEAGAAFFSSSLTIAEPVGDKNTIFWVKATSSEGELPGRDVSVKLTGAASVTAA